MQCNIENNEYSRVNDKSCDLKQQLNDNLPIFSIKKKIVLRNKHKLGILSQEFPLRMNSSKQLRNQLLRLNTGDNNCQWVCDVISQLDIISEIVNFSSITKHVFDILIRLKNDANYNIYGIQVRTLSVNKSAIYKNVYHLHLEKGHYPSKTLIIYINNERNKFLIGLVGEIEDKNTYTVYFDTYDSKLESYKVTNLEDLKKSLSILIPQSVIVDNIRDGIKCSNDLKSYDSVRMIQKIFENSNHKFEYENTIDSTIDIYINDHSCQCKMTSELKCLLYKCNLNKMVNGKEVPYELGDFEYLIVQIHDYRYTNDICIIPMDVLIDQGHIRTNNQQGHTSFMISPPRHNEYHWSEALWNNYQIISNNLKTNLDPIYQFSKRFGCQFKDTKFKDSNLYQTAISHYTINHQSKKYIIIFINDGEKRLYPTKIFLISIDDLIKGSLVPTANQKIKRLHIASPDYKRKHWSLAYWKNIDDLNNMILKS